VSTATKKGGKGLPGIGGFMVVSECVANFFECGRLKKEIPGSDQGVYRRDISFKES
jgi:hypothetical protein